MNSPLHTEWVDTCKRFSDYDYVLLHLSELHHEFETILSEPNGPLLVESGIALFAYLADAISDDRQNVFEIWHGVKIGYPNDRHSDLFAPFFDVSRTQLLWSNATTNLQTLSPEIQAEIILNILFRWNIITMELMRKILSYCAYCQSHIDGQFDVNQHNNRLYGTGDPARYLRNTGNHKRSVAATRFYDPSLRHAIAHGNVFLALPNLVAVRYSFRNPNRFVQKEFDVQNDKTAIDKIMSEFHEQADSCFQTIRVFFFIYSMIDKQFGQLLSESWPKGLQNVLFSVMIDKTQSDPDGLHFWSNAR